MAKSSVVCLFLASLVSGTSAKLLRSDSRKGLPYDYEEVICGFKGKKQPWCVDWLNCLSGKANGDETKIMEAWDPADCEEYCGRYPVTSPLEGQGGALLATGSRRNTTSLLTRVDSWLAHVQADQTTLHPWTPSHVLAGSRSLRKTLNRADRQAKVENSYEKILTAAKETVHTTKKSEASVATRKDKVDDMMADASKGFNCMTTCRKFQEGLSSCVGAIMLNPGALAKMGAGGDEDEGPEICTKKETPCLADLPLKYQRCLSKSTHAVLDGKEFEDDECATLAEDFKECEDCPLYKQNPMEYISYVGGCKMRLNVYWQATSPRAGKHAHPGASGCQVH